MPDPYRLSFSRAAQERMQSLSSKERLRLEEMLQEIGEEATAFAALPGGAPSSAPPLANQLLALEIGRATVRYVIDTVARAITVQHVLVSRHAPFTVVWADQASAEMSAVHPEVREHIVRQIGQVAELAGTEATLRIAYRDKPPRDVAWSFEGHTVCYTLDGGRFQLTVSRVLAPGTRSAG